MSTTILRIKSWTAVAAALWLVGCASGVKLDDTPVESRTPVPLDAGADAGKPGAATAPGSGASQSQVTGVDLTKGGAVAVAPTAGRVVYFDFDSFVVKDEFRGLITTHSRTLSANKGKRMLVEGHADERGGREYNLALGQKRAEAVVKSLVLLGAGQEQLEAVSFGKERPVDEGHDEAAWAKNRRAELKDR